MQKVYKLEEDNNINMLPGDPKGLPDESLSSEKTLVFIDGAFLSKLSKYLGEGKYIRFNRILFAEKISEKKKLICNKIFLYITPPFQDSVPSLNDENRKKGYDSFIENLKSKGVIVREGRCQRLKCEDNYNYKQKAVDILLAIDLMNVRLDFQKIKKIILISSDSDFVPVIKALEEKGIQTILYTYYEKKRNSNFSRSNELIKSVYKYVLLSKSDFDSVLLERRKK